MKRLLVSVVVLAFAMPCVAQTVQPPKPGPEVQRLGYFVGTWTFVGEILTDPKGTYEGTVTWKWLPGGFSVVGKPDGTAMSGNATGELTTLSYTPTYKAYTWLTVRRGRLPEGGKSSVSGNVWTCEEEATVGGKPAKRRQTLTEVSPTSYSYKVERSVEGGPWTQTIDLKATKVK
jgi:hypothetical protein